MAQTTGRMGTVKQLKRRLFLLRALSFLCTIGPLVGIFIVNWSSYVQRPADAIKLSFGAVMVVVVLVITALGKLGIPRRIVVEAVLLAMAYFLQPLLTDLVMILGVVLAGEVVDFLFFKQAIKRTSEELLVEKASDRSADKTASKVEEILNNYIGGRV